jgi:Mn2+/Fe2+ NRAMP family transporter
VRFYSIISAATFIGLAISFSGIDPMRTLVWSAVDNGIVAVPVMAAMMWVASRRDRMGQFTAGLCLMIFGWGATAVMAAAAAAMLVSM